MARVVVVTMGTYGDVVPYLGLGRRLSATGHAVMVATVARFGAMVAEAGLAFHELPALDPREASLSDDGRAAGRGGLRGMLAMVRSARAILRRPVPAMIDAADGADILLCTAATSFLVAPIAESRGLPCLVLTLQPTEPTGEHGPTILGERNLGTRLNRALPAMAARAGLRMFAGVVRDVRHDLGLPATPAPGYRSGELTVLTGASPLVYPRPSDWRAGVEVVGYWWPPATDRAPDPALVDFLARGPAPLYVGFGSMGADRGEQLSAVVREALDRTGRRAVVARGWAELSVEGPDVFVVDDVPHEWLFPQVVAVVHQAGAGTSAAGLRAGVPAVPVPFGYDQPVWARRLVRLGTAPRVVPAGRLRADRLAAAIEEAAQDPAYRRAAGSIARRLATEDGAARVVEIVDGLVGQRSGC